MNYQRPPVQERILTAAAEIAKELGTAHLSLDAVAARAGISKGGLLYHFSSKAKLLEAIVEDHVAALDDTIAKAAQADDDQRNASARAYIDAFRCECSSNEPPPSGILAAIAENPEFLNPIRRFQRETVQRFKQECDDPVPAIVAFLAIEGIRSLKLFDSNMLTIEDQKKIVEYLKASL
jgi:AcrR family transcriptional regulator